MLAPVPRPSRRLGEVLGLTAISAAAAFGWVREPPRPTGFRTLSAAEREAMVETTADGLRPPKISQPRHDFGVPQLRP